MSSSKSILQKYVSSNSELANTYLRWSNQNFNSEDVVSFIKEGLIAYIRSLATTKTRYSTYFSSNQPLLPNEARGLRIFSGKAGCVACHPPPDFTDNDFHDVGLYRRKIIFTSLQIDGRVVDSMGPDQGRGNVVEGIENLFEFRTPSLVNVALTGPYMHDGSLPTLEAVIDFYNRGGDNSNSHQKSLGLTTEEKRSLIAFLEALSDLRFTKR
jgi:cytochrome c peroxidase